MVFMSYYLTASVLYEHHGIVTRMISASARASGSRCSGRSYQNEGLPWNRPGIPSPDRQFHVRLDIDSHAFGLLAPKLP